MWGKDGDGWRGTWDANINGQPISFHGDFELMPTSKGCHYSAETRVTDKVPIIGNQIEKALEGNIASDLMANLEYTNK
jgi:hypothetical protein